MKEEVNDKKSNFLTVTLITLLLFLSQYTWNELYEPGYFSYSAIFLIGIISSFILIRTTIKLNDPINLNIVDLSFLVFVFSMFLRWINSDNSWIYSKAAVTFTTIPVYFSIKQFRSIYLIHWAIILSGTIQIAVFGLQWMGLLHNNNLFFVTGGTLGNPNVLAMVLLLSILSGIFLIKRVRLHFLKYLIRVFLLLALLVIVYTRCRTAILAGIFIGFFILFKNIWIANRVTKPLRIGTLLGASTLFIFLLFEKSESLIGRYLIWQSSFVKICEKPFWGHGISSFHQVYPDAQRLFLETNSNTNFLKLADTPQWAYNDFLELWLEGGIFTVLAFIGILISILYCWKTQKQFNINRNNLAFLSATIFFIFAAVNFAYTAWPIFLIFIFNLAWSARTCRNIIQVKLIPILRLELVLALLLVFSNIILGIETGKTILFQYKLKRVDSLPKIRQHEFYLDSKEKYKFYAPFVYHDVSHLKRENKQQEALLLLHQLNNQAPSFETNYQLAESYLEESDLNNALIFYKKSTDFLPNRINPYFQIFMIELSEKEFKKADSIKTWILHNDFKGDEKIAEKIKTTLKRYSPGNTSDN